MNMTMYSFMRICAICTFAGLAAVINGILISYEVPPTICYLWGYIAGSAVTIFIDISQR